MAQFLVDLVDLVALAVWCESVVEHPTQTEQTVTNKKRRRRIIDFSPPSDG